MPNAEGRWGNKVTDPCYRHGQKLVQVEKGADFEIIMAWINHAIKIPGCGNKLVHLSTYSKLVSSLVPRVLRIKDTSQKKTREYIFMELANSPTTVVICKYNHHTFTSFTIMNSPDSNDSDIFASFNNAEILQNLHCIDAATKERYRKMGSMPSPVPSKPEAKELGDDLFTSFDDAEIL